VRIDGELAASLTVQFWAIRSRGRLLDLAGQHIESGEHAGRRGIRNSVARSQNDVPCTTVVRHTEEPLSGAPSPVMNRCQLMSLSCDMLIFSTQGLELA